MVESKWVEHSRSPGLFKAVVMSMGAWGRLGLEGHTCHTCVNGGLRVERAGGRKTGSSLPQKLLCAGCSGISSRRQHIFPSIFLTFILQRRLLRRHRARVRSDRSAVGSPSQLKCLESAPDLQRPKTRGSSQDVGAGEGHSLSWQLSRPCPHREQHLPYLLLHPGQSRPAVVVRGKSLRSS